MDLSTAILVVDDDAGIREAMTEYFSNHGFIVESAANAGELNSLLSRRTWDLIVLDVMMPGEDGLTILKRLQQEGNTTPIIIQSAMGSDTDRIVGLELGAEDYLSKPANPRELLARIRTVLRRVRRPETTPKSPAPTSAPAQPQGTGSAAGPIYTFSGWTVDIVNRVVADPEDTLITLSDSEFRLLRAFLEHPRRVLTRDQLLYYAHGDDADSFDRAIDVQISRLRRKLDKQGQFDLIRTVRNEGYMFNHQVSLQS